MVPCHGIFLVSALSLFDLVLEDLLQLTEEHLLARSAPLPVLSCPKHGQLTHEFTPALDTPETGLRGLRNLFRFLDTDLVQLLVERGPVLLVGGLGLLRSLGFLLGMSRELADEQSPALDDLALLGLGLLPV